MLTERKFMRPGFPPSMLACPFQRDRSAHVTGAGYRRRLLQEDYLDQCKPALRKGDSVPEFCSGWRNERPRPWGPESAQTNGCDIISSPRELPCINLRG